MKPAVFSNDREGEYPPKAWVCRHSPMMRPLIPPVKGSVRAECPAWWVRLYRPCRAAGCSGGTRGLDSVLLEAAQGWALAARGANGGQFGIWASAGSRPRWKDDGQSAGAQIGGIWAKKGQRIWSKG